MRTTRFLFLLAGFCIDPHARAAEKVEFPLPPHGSIRMPVPEGWRGEWTPGRLPTLEFGPASGRAFKVLTSWMPKSQPGISLPEKVKDFSEGSAAQSVEKKATIRELEGSSVAGNYFSFTDADPKPGEFTYLTQGMLQSGDVEGVFTILSNDATQKIRDSALEMLAGIEVRPFPPGTWEVMAPGEKWELVFSSTGLATFQQEKFPNGYRARAGGSEGINLSIFIEKPHAEGTNHQDVFNFYWPQAKRNPLIDPSSIQIRDLPRFKAVTYATGPALHANYYFAYEGKWMDVHFSAVSVGGTDAEKARAAFEKQLNYQVIPKRAP